MKYKSAVIDAVEQVMREAYYLTPDLNNDGELKVTFSDNLEIDEGYIVKLMLAGEGGLYFRYNRELTKLMAQYSMGTSADELKEEHLQAVAQDASEMVGGAFLMAINSEESYEVEHVLSMNGEPYVMKELPSFAVYFDGFTMELYMKVPEG